MEKRNRRARKKIAPWIAALAFITLFGSYIGALIWSQLQIRAVGGASVLIGIYIAVLAAMIIGIVIALIQRLKEINGGEEDEALQY